MRAGRIIGTYQAKARGFGFIVPDAPVEGGDLFVPEGESLDAMTGDRVAAVVLAGAGQDGQARARIDEILVRGRSRFVGELARTSSGGWEVRPQGRLLNRPILVDDVGPAEGEGVKVVVELTRFPKGSEPGRGVIVENLGTPGPADVETLGILREHGLPDRFPDAVQEAARAAAAAFDPDGRDDPGREDFTGTTVLTIDPDDARDFDDALGVTASADGWTLAVHIADVSAFVTEGAVLDVEARERGNSTYFPRKVVPMLPETLSNGVCSLQPGQVRWVKSVFVDYDAGGNVLAARFANGRIRSARRLTYLEAQSILDGRTGGYPAEVVDTLVELERLARTIEQRRRDEGMLHLDLPEVDLVLSPDGRVVDARAADDSYTHTLVEMFMVEANEAVARLLDSLRVPFLRRVHPDSDEKAGKELSAFLKACGLKVPKALDRQAIQELVDRARTTPVGRAVNLALLKTLKRAVYSPQDIGHYALASRHYCHFTSPIRRYPDLTIHRLLDAHLRGTLAASTPDATEVEDLGAHCTATERRSDEASRDLKDLLVLEMLDGRMQERVRAAGRKARPDVLDGVITSVTSFGIFVQSTRYLIEGLLRLEALGDDWWEADPVQGTVTGRRSGRRLRLGDPITVRVARVDLPTRRLDWALESLGSAGKRGGARGPKERGDGQRGRAQRGGMEGAERGGRKGARSR